MASSYPILQRYANMQVNVKQLQIDGMLASIRYNQGKTIFVCSSGTSTADGLSPSRPISTLAGGLAACTQAGNVGDVIYVLPGHAENISDNTTLKLNVSGVQIIGLGFGAQRPTFTLDTGNTTAIPVSAANISVTNCIFIANFLSIAACFTLTTAKDFNCIGCLFRDTNATHNFLNIFKSTGAANTVDGLTVTDNQWTSLGTSSVNTFVLTANDIDRFTALRNNITMLTTVNAGSLLIVTTGVITNADVGYNKCYRQNTTSTASLIQVGGTTSTGFVYNNYTQTLDTATNVLFTTSVGLAAFENRITGVVGATGFVIPALDS